MKKLCFITTISITLKSFILEFAKYMHEHSDYDITFICDKDDDFATSLPPYIHYIPVSMKRGISIGGIKACAQMYKIFKENKFDLIQYSTPNASLYASIAAKFAGCKVRNYHLMGLRYLGASGFSKTVLKAIEKITCYNSTSIECVSKSNMELGINERLFSEHKAVVVWNGSSGGVDLSRFDCSKRAQWRKEVRFRYGYNDNDFIYGFVGRITKDKGINELLEAFLNLETDSKLLLIGQFENEEMLNCDMLKKARQHHNVKFHSAVSDIERYYAAIDVLIFPSYREGFGNVLIEAGAVGTPAIVSDISGPIDAIQRDETALVVPVKDSRALAEAMKQIRTIDYKNMGQKAAEFAKEKFNSEILYQKILERKEKLLMSSSK